MCTVNKFYCVTKFCMLKLNSKVNFILLETKALDTLYKSSLLVLWFCHYNKINYSAYNWSLCFYNVISLCRKKKDFSGITSTIQSEMFWGD